MPDMNSNDENAEPGQIDSAYEDAPAPPPLSAEYDDDADPDPTDVSEHAKEE